MKLLSLFIFTSIIFGCIAIKKVKHSESLNGVWIPVKQEVSGKEVPASAFNKQTLTIQDSAYTFIAESTDKGIAKYSNGKMDIYGKQGVNAGRHITAIYQLEHGQLTICYNLLGDSYPTAFETKSKPTLFMSVFKKSE